MALLSGMIKNCVLALLLLLATGQSATAASFSVKRGINLDIWTTWPEESRWGDPAVILPFPEWRRSLDEAGLRKLKAAGFDFVRMPVDPAPFLSEKTQGLRERLLESVHDSARLVNAAGLKVIVDLHLIPAGGNRSIGMAEVMQRPELFDAYVELVRAMARTLAQEDPSLVALELMNEPLLDCEADGTNLWPERLSRLFAAARASATRLTLVLSGACGGSADTLAKVDPRALPDGNILWSFHSYQPFLLTHQGATWAGDFIPHVTGLPFPLDAVPRHELEAAVEKIRERIRREAPWMRQAGLLSYLDEQIVALDTEEELHANMDKPFTVVSDWARRNGIAPSDVLLGEFGMIRQEYGSDFVMPAASRAAYVRNMIEDAEAHGFAWAVWSYGGAFGIVEEFDGRPAEPDVMEMIRRLPTN